MAELEQQLERTGILEDTNMTQDHNDPQRQTKTVNDTIVPQLQTLHQDMLLIQYLTLREYMLERTSAETPPRNQ